MQKQMCSDLVAQSSLQAVEKALDYIYETLLFVLRFKKNSFVALQLASTISIQLVPDIYTLFFKHVKLGV